MRSADSPDAARVRLWRANRGFTQREAAEWYGVTERTWQRYESGERSVPRPLLRRILPLARRG